LVKQGHIGEEIKKGFGMGKTKKKKSPGKSAPPIVQRTDLFWRLVGLFTLSGVSGLIYQVVWSRLIVLIFGSATYAVATVLGVFFFGLALGSYLAGRYASRFSGQLALYGYLEIGVGAYAGLFFVLLSAVQGLHGIVFPWIYESQTMLILVRISLSGLLLLPPTILMGATLPVISALLTRSSRYLGQDFGIVFAYNTFGAGAGCFLSAFYLIPALGLRWTTACGALLSIAVGVASIYWARDADAASIVPEQKELPIKPSAGQLWVGPLQAYATLIAFLVSGFLGLVYEVAWSRTLILLFGTSVYAFATMLTTYLIGLALGSLCMSRWSDRFANPLFAFAVIQIVIGSAIFVTTPVLGQLPHFFIDLFQIDTSWRTVTLTEFAACFAIMFVPAFGSGALFPLAARIFLHQRQFQIGRTIADAYTFNTLGAIAGSFAAGFFFIPWIGMEKTLLAGAGVNLAVASGLIICSQNLALRKKVLVAATLLSVAGVGFVTLQTWVPLAMNAGVYVYGDALAKTKEQIAGFVRDNRLLYYREGPSDTVAVIESANGRFLRINGKTDGGDISTARSDNYTQRFLGLLPLMYTPQAQRALVIGLGTGVTLGAVQCMPGIKIDCIEISPSVVEASRYFERANGNALNAPGTRLYVLDGRTWINAMPRQYDLIVSEPSHPWQTGNANLFTTDFFEASARRLTPGGVFCQWLPYYHMDKEHFRIIVNSFSRTFPYINIFVVYTDTILIGSKAPLTLASSHMDNLMVNSAFRQHLASLGIDSAAQLLSFFYLDAEAVHSYLQGVDEVNSDDHPIIEYTAPKYLLAYQRAGAFYDIFKHSLKARLPLHPASLVAALENDRIRQRIPYYRKWGVPEHVIQQMLQAHSD
jgi:spermidine synthase